MFSQRDEEEYILKFFKDKLGRFLDIGAYDGKCFSTTHALALKGWSGICIEPSPSVFPALDKLYFNNNKIKTIKVAVSNVVGEIDFYDCGGDMVSSIDKDHVKLWEQKGGCTFTKIKVESITGLELFSKLGFDFNFISLDVEGTNLDIFNQFPFEKLIKTKMLCIEFDGQADEVLKIAGVHGFNLYHTTAENLLLTR